MNLLYRIALAFTTFLLPLVAVFSTKINHFLKGRKGLMQKLSVFRSENAGNLAWFHVASLGEYEQAKPVIEKFKKAKPDYLIAVSFFSPSGYDIATRRPQPNVDFISYIPLDRKSAAFQFVKTLNPSFAFFAKYDLWHHHILALKSQKVPTILFSASFREDQKYFSSNGFFRKILMRMDLVFTQNQKSLELLDSIGYEQGILAGDTRFDRVRESASNPKSFPEIEAWVKGKKVMVLGSVWEEDMQLLIPLINKRSDINWIIAPHDLNPEPMDKWSESIQKRSIKYSQSKDFSNSEVLFIDNIGMLSSLYQYASIAYVGGAFGKGLHNILEPLGFGVPVIFGELKNPQKFPEAAISVKEKCGFSVKNAESLIQLVDELQEEKLYSQAVNAANSWVESNLGAAEIIVSKVLSNFPNHGR